MTKILIALNDGNWGGVAQSVFNVVANMNNFSFEFVFGSQGAAISDFKELGWPVRVMDFSGSQFSFRTFQKLRAIVRSSNASLIHAHHPRAYLRTRLAAKIEKVPHLSTPHVSILDELDCSSTPEYRRRYMLLREHVTAGLDEATIALSDQNKERLVEQGIPEEQIVLIPNGVDLSRFQHTSSDEELQEPSKPKNTLVVGFVGRLAPEKGLSDLVKSFSALPERTERGQRVELLVVGDGPELQKLRGLSAELGVAKRVSFVGRQDDVAHFLSRMDIVVFTSYRETLPTALLEAMAMAKPVVAVNIPAFSSILSSDEGFLTDRKGITKTLKRVMSNPGIARRVGEAGLDLVRKKYDLKRQVTSLTDLYCKHAC